LITLITTHSSPDFDGIAAAYGLSKLYPESRLFLPQAGAENVRRFLADFSRCFPLWEEPDLSQVNRLVMADFSSWKRAGTLEVLREKVPLHIYDHHRHYVPESQLDFAQPLGATTTLVVEIARKRRLFINPWEATLFLIGIYEDTGFLAYPSTTDRDRKQAAFLKKKACMELVHEYLRVELNSEQEKLLSLLKKNTERITVAQKNIMIAHAELDAFKSEISPILHFWDRAGSALLLVLVRIGERTLVILRSSDRELSAQAIARRLGGGGLDQAASATVTDMNAGEIRERIMEYLRGEEIRIADLKRYFSPRYTKLLLNIGRIAAQQKMKIYLVGGIVRDLLCGRENSDLDLVAEGNVLELGKLLSKSFGLHMQFHAAFKTCSLEDKKRSLRFDLARARKEVYRHPGALPEVTDTSIEEDLKRRDFSINAMAVSLNPGDFGRIIDPFDGQKDLKEHRLRVLHEKSFIEDPTRILRGIRFLKRFGLEWEKKTSGMLDYAFRKKALSSISAPRFKDEFFLFFREPEWKKCLLYFLRRGGGRFIHPGLANAKNIIKILGLAEDALFDFLIYLNESDLDKPLFYLLVLAKDLPFAARKELAARLALTAYQRAVLLFSKEKFSRVKKLLLKKTASRATIFQLLKELKLEHLLLLSLYFPSREKRRVLLEYFLIFRSKKTAFSGSDLKRMGIEPGPAMGRILKNLEKALFEGKVRGKLDEWRFLQKRLKKTDKKNYT